MSEPHYGWNMDRSAPTAGSVKQARERAQAGHAPPRRPERPFVLDDSASSPQGHLSPPPRRHMPPSHPPPPLPSYVTPPLARPRQAPAPPGGHVISRPTQAPHWPLPPGSPLTPGNYEKYQPPPGRPLQAPPRPARPSPSRIPSMVDQSQPQQPTPVFFHPQSESEDEFIQEPGQDVHNPETPATTSSRWTGSSVGTIPEFPAPGTDNVPPMPIPPRRSANLGPPPSSRRGASSFYSNASYVSPIPEESSRSHGSYASSAAMPEAWSPSPETSPQVGEAFYDDSLTEKSRESIGEDYGDESKLVRSASIGKKTKAALVDNKPGPAASKDRPSPRPVQKAFESGTGYMDESNSSSNTVPVEKKAPEETATRQDNQFLSPMGIAGAQDPSKLSPQPSPSRLSAIRRPPKLDMDAVRAAEARGSMTSLPDLIKRATRLATMIERGKRPASRFDNFNDLLEKSNAAEGGRDDSSNERHASGLSDMLAAFPPPAALTPNARNSRGSWFRTTSWPLAPGQQRHMDYDPNGRYMNEKAGSEDSRPRKTRRCCGMPPWAFVLVVLLVLGIIATAIVVPLSFLVFHTLGPSADASSSSDKCQVELDCKNGGTSVVSKGVCSCICTNGFTGRDCNVQGSDGCTTTNLVATDSSSSIDNVTLGDAIPRLIADANSNFSIPLSGTQILAKINTGDISCRAQNSLVTFDGRPTRTGESDAKVEDVDDDQKDVTVNKATRAVAAALDLRASGSSTFNVTEEILDFARVAVLYILQEENSDAAESAQSTLQQLFSRADESDPRHQQVTDRQARNVTVGQGNTVDLLSLRVDVGDGSIGKYL